MIKTFSFRTLGCRLNHSESDSIQYDLTRRGLRAVSCLEPADLTVINS
ncbi:MAG: tRNA (N(6)-L-threonylcarbamoyladenosine(37)-C(2))-methylthiotransferase MtaB, partial [Candidatus Marinimicrobia bacterium]|nr:tRNA (N(6)-L-threonylcarbamoyladenosine(37)-C(2))-methylthiotransferase MtaB [Candidatus Neomarinimicrobiota bacterium]